jgi:hypothetical protein
MLMQSLGDRLYADGGFSRFVAPPADVVGPDHDDGRLGWCFAPGQMLESPQDVIGSIATESKIDRMERSERSFPYLFSDTFEIVGNRVPDHQQVNLLFFELPDLLGMPFEPPFLQSRLRANGRIVLLCFLANQIACVRYQ